jgi:pyridoxal phosphate enzyme (YggS family)
MTIAENIAQVRQTIATTCERAGRKVDEVTLLAVSKTQPVEAILGAAAVGVQHFGENRVEEAVDKIPVVNAQLKHPVTWHMVGHIQSRKARDIPPLFQVVHSVERLKIANRLSQQMVEQGGLLDVLLEINVSGEASKGGFEAAYWADSRTIREALWQAVAEVRKLPGLRVHGLMTMAPIVEDMEQTRPVFVNLAALRDAMAADQQIDLPALSMGMTDDYPIAIEEGATIVRVGRAIFGPRQQ